MEYTVQMILYTYIIQASAGTYRICCTACQIVIAYNIEVYPGVSLSYHR